jgi:tetratricopeptide (TPR) repeat protein
MNYPRQLCRPAVRFGLVFLLLLPLTTQGQRPSSVDSPDAAQLAKIIQDIQAKRVGPDRMAVIRAAGFQLVAASRFEEAKDLFTAILEVAPRDQQASYGGALALFNLRQLPQAESLARSALESAKRERAAARPAEVGNWRSRESDSLVLLGVILAVKGDNAGALNAVRGAVALAPENFDAQFTLGRALYGAGDLANAVIAFRKAIIIRPQDLQARFFLATVLEGAGQYDQAREAYADLIRIQPRQAEGHLGLGALLLKQADNAEEGISELAQAVKLKGDLYEARVALGRALIKVGRADQALEHLDRAAQLAPENPEPHYQLAIAYRRLGKTEAAERESANVKEINSLHRNVTATSTGSEQTKKDIPALLVRTRAYLAEQRTTEALDLADQIEKLAGDEPRALYTLGLQFAEAQQYDRAAKLFMRTNDLRPNTGEVLYNLGIALYNLDRLTEAAKALESAAALTPNDADPLYRLGLIASAQSNSALALGYWQKAVTLRANYADAYFLMAEELSKNERTVLAVEYYDKAITSDPSKLLYYVRLGATYFRRRHYSQAKEVYERAATRFSTSPEIHYLVGYAARAEGLYDDALAAFQRALAIQPNNADVLANLGYINSERGHYDEAEKLLRQALALNGEHFPANYDLGRLLTRLKRYDEALPILEHGASLSALDPGIHYQLFLTYSRLKRKTDADRELAVFKRLEEARKKGDTSMEGSATVEPSPPDRVERIAPQSIKENH